MSELHSESRGSGPLVVLVHGVGGSTELWSEVVDRLADRYRCVAVDLLGFGRSPALPEGDWTVADWAGSLAGFLEGLGEVPQALVGHSLGGMVTQELLLAGRVPVGTAALCNTIPGATEQVRQINETLAEMAEGSGSEALAEALAPGLIGPGPLEATERARRQTQAIMAASDRQALARALRAICRFDALDRLGAIDVPVLVLAGEHEGNLEDQRRLARALRRGSLLVMKEAGHMAPMEAPSTFAEALQAFIERSAKGAR